MKKSLLATVAAVALFTTTGMAAAAEGGRDQSGAPGMSQGTTKSGMSKGAEKNGAELKGKSETTGAAANGAAEPRAQGADAKSGPSPDSNEVKKDVAPKAGTKANTDKANSDKTKPSTTGQASDKSAPAAKSGAMGKDEPAARSSTTDKSAPAAKSAADEKSGAPASSAQNSPAGSAGGSVALTSDQKTKIRTSVLQSGSAPKVSRSSINFNIRVGTVVPRSGVRFVTVPDTIVEIHPAWRGYSYFIVDEEIIIVEPSSFRIVAVLNV